ncbi:MAG: hypothetical protein Q9195_006454 [Heterodermia aff. obscurata]
MTVLEKNSHHQNSGFTCRSGSDYQNSPQPDYTPPPASSPSSEYMIPYQSNIYQLPLPPIPNLNLHDLNIFHHYATQTAASLSDRKSVQRTWRVAVTKEALPHDFLMHALLSFASAHLAQICPAQRQMYGASAVAHRNIALRSGIPHLRNVTPKNCHALFVFSSVIAISTFSIPSSPSIPLDSRIDNILTFIVLIRGVNTVLQSGLDWIQTGSLEALLQTERVDWRQKIGPVPMSLRDAIQELRARNDQHTLGTHWELYTNTIEKLESFYGAYAVVASDRSLVFIWCAIVPAEFVARLRERDPMALLVLAHWAVLLHSVSAQWWAGERGKLLVEAIYQELDEEWKAAAQWPMEIVQSPWSP